MGKIIILPAADVQGTTATEIFSKIKELKDGANKNHQKLSENELNAIFDVHNGLMLSMTIPLRVSIVSNMKAADFDGEVSEKWDIDTKALCDKIDQMDDAECEDIASRIGSFWLDLSDYDNFAEQIAYSGMTFHSYQEFLALDYQILNFFLRLRGLWANQLCLISDGCCPTLSLLEELPE
jgi:hypothetical protein